MTKKNWKILGDGGSTTDPLEWKFQGGGRVKTERPSVGGYGYFLETHNREKWNFFKLIQNGYKNISQTNCVF